MNNFKIISASELKNLYHKYRTELGPNGIGREIQFLSLSGDNSYVITQSWVVSYRPSKDPSFFLTLAFQSGNNFIVLEDIEVVAFLYEDEGSEEDEETPMVGAYEGATKLMALINRNATHQKEVTARRASFRVI